MDEAQDFGRQRARLVEFMSGFALKTSEIKEAFCAVKRENFVHERVKGYAYDDNALPIGQGQTISQPSTIAIMLELLGAKKGMKVLEVGSGSGYVLALLARIVGEDGVVFGVEINEKLAEKSVKNLDNEGIKNAQVKKGDGSLGWKEKAPFERIIVSCACPYIPKELFNQLAEGGRVVAPVGDQGTQIMEVMVKEKGKPLKKTFEGSLFTFVPMKGKTSF